MLLTTKISLDLGVLFRFDKNVSLSAESLKSDLCTADDSEKGGW